MSHHTLRCWVSQGHDILVTLRAPLGPQPTDILAPKACEGRAASGPGDGGRCPWHRTCRGPVTGAWCSSRPGRGGWRLWCGSSREYWDNEACSSETPGDGDQCQSRDHTWTQRYTWDVILSNHDRLELYYLSEGPSLASSQRPLSDTLRHWDMESSLSPGQYTAMLRTPASENSKNNCQAQVKVKSSPSPQSPSRDPKVWPSLKIQKTEIFGLGLT